MADKLKLWRNEWVSMTEIAKELTINPAKLSRVVKNAKVPTQKDPLDQRKVLVQRASIYELFRRHPPTEYGPLHEL